MQADIITFMVSRLFSNESQEALKEKDSAPQAYHASTDIVFISILNLSMRNNSTFPMNSYIHKQIISTYMSSDSLLVSHS